jgi:SpoVK/Ycf46/Vps4 family AAA+-type ATPase
MRECMRKVQNLLKAKIQCIWIETYEETEVIKDLKEIASDLSLKLFTWSHTEGLKPISLSKREQQQEADNKIKVERIFSVIGEAQACSKEAKDEGIYVIKDLHLINDSHQVKRMLRDIKERSGAEMRCYNPIIVVAPVVNIPIEHEKLFTIVHYDTPSKTEIRAQINKMVSNIRAAVEKKKDYKIPTDKEVDQIINACVGLTYNEITDVLSKSIIQYKALSLKAILEEKIQLVEKAGVLDYIVPDARFEDIGGNDSWKLWVEEEEASMTDEAKEFGCSVPKGYLALGVPGTAKTYAAEAIAQKWGVPLLKLNMSKIMNKLVGESEKKIEQAFRVAKACAPCVFLIDEVEKALAGTKSSNASDAGTTSRVFSSVLQFMNDDNGVFVVMTSNDVSQLPPELTRSGRLDAMWYFSLPTEEERKEIFRIHIGKTNRNVDDSVINEVAKATDNYSGAEIKEIVKAAMRKAFKRFKEDGNRELTEVDLMSAVHDVIPVFESSREKIMFLENWVHGRARYTNQKVDENGFYTESDTELENGLTLKDLD